MTTAPDPIKVYDARWEEEEFTDDQVRRLLEASLAYGRLLGADTVGIRVSATEMGAVRSYFSAGEASIGQAVEDEIRIIFGERFGGQVID